MREHFESSLVISLTNQNIVIWQFLYGFDGIKVSNYPLISSTNSSSFVSLHLIYFVLGIWTYFYAYIYFE